MKKLPSWAGFVAVGACGALALCGANGLTGDQIQQQAARLEGAARARVVCEASSFEPMDTAGSRYSLDSAYEAKNAAGETVGYVGTATVNGYGGPIEVTTGLDTSGVITGVEVGGEGFDETPGLGGFTRDRAFTDQFVGRTAGIVLNEDGVDSIAGATISSSAVTGAVNAAAGYVCGDVLGIFQEQEETFAGQTVSATEQGFAGDVTVTVGFAEDKTIAYMAVDTPNETDGLGKRASESAFTSQFIGKTGPFTYGEDGIEALSGATFTSNAVINALNSIVAGGGTMSAEPVTATVQGFGGDVTVTARLNDDNSIAGLSIDTPNETDGLGKRASEPEFTNQFIGKYAPFTYGEDGIEALTGATVTSTAVINALNDIVPGGEAAPAANVEAAPAAQPGAEPEAQLEAAPEAEPEAEPAAEPEAEPAMAVTNDASPYMRPRPVVPVDVSRYMRPRPAFTAKAPEEAAVTEEADPAARFMRPRPAATALEAATTGEAQSAEADSEDVQTDASRYMRERPVAQAIEQTEVGNSETVSGDASAYMRERPAVQVQKQTEVSDAIEEAVIPSGDAERYMRPRPTAAWVNTEAEAEEIPAETEAAPEAEESADTEEAAPKTEESADTEEAVPDTAAAADAEEAADSQADVSRYMRPRPTGSAS